MKKINRGDNKKRKSQSRYAAVEAKARHLEVLLKAAKPIGELIRRSITMNKYLNDSKESSLSETKSLSFHNNETTCVSQKESILSLEEIFGDQELRIFLLQQFSEHIDLHKFFLKGATDEDIFSKPSLFMYSFYSIAFLVADAFRNFNFEKLEIQAVKLAKELIPQIYSKPSIDNIRGLLLYGAYYSKKRKLFKSKNCIEMAFTMFQTLNVSLSTFSEHTHFLSYDNIEANEKSSDGEAIWSYILLCKKYVTVIYGNISMFRQIDIISTSYDEANGNIKTSQEVGFTRNAIIASTINHAFEINLIIIQDSLSPPDVKFHSVINDRRSTILSFEKQLFNWQKSLGTLEDILSSKRSFVNMFDLNLVEPRKIIIDISVSSFIRIVIHWPTILIFKYPLPFHSISAQVLMETALDMYQLLEIWELEYASKTKLSPSYQVPFSCRTFLMTCIIFMNHAFYSQEISIFSVARAKSKVLFIESLFHIYMSHWDGSESVLLELQEAKSNFSFDCSN